MYKVAFILIIAIIVIVTLFYNKDALSTLHGNYKKKENEQFQISGYGWTSPKTGNRFEKIESCQPSSGDTIAISHDNGYWIGLTLTNCRRENGKVLPCSNGHSCDVPCVQLVKESSADSDDFLFNVQHHFGWVLTNFGSANSDNTIHNYYIRDDKVEQWEERGASLEHPNFPKHVFGKGAEKGWCTISNFITPNKVQIFKVTK